MKLFDPEAPNTFVFAVVPVGAREGTDPTYNGFQAGSIESAELQLDLKRLRNAYPYVVGRYDDQGRYCTYQPPIEGVMPGRFIVHPTAHAEYAAQRWS